MITCPGLASALIRGAENEIRFDRYQVDLVSLGKSFGLVVTRVVGDDQGSDRAAPGLVATFDLSEAPVLDRLMDTGTDVLHTGDLDFDHGPLRPVVLEQDVDPVAGPKPVLDHRDGFLAESEVTSVSRHVELQIAVCGSFPTRAKYSDPRLRERPLGERHHMVEFDETQGVDLNTHRLISPPEVTRPLLRVV